VLPPLNEVRAEQARRSFYEFVKLMWPVLEPGRQFVDGLHIRLICDALEKVTRGEIARLLINLPPRHGKSNLVSILWPAWVWIDQPDRRWLTASYAQPLAERHSTDTRRLIESPQYQELFGDRYQLSLRRQPEGALRNHPRRRANRDERRRRRDGRGRRLPDR